jgi:hypothetical protein
MMRDGDDAIASRIRVRTNPPSRLDQVFKAPETSTHSYFSIFVDLTVGGYCVRTGHIPPATLDRHCDLRGHVDAYRCCVKSLIGRALVGFGVRQHARWESITKHAPFNTRASRRRSVPGSDAH